MVPGRSTQATYRSHVPGCFIRIRNGFSSLSKGERLVAEAILRNPHAVTLESVTDLARRSNTSPAAVSRCQPLLPKAGVRHLPTLQDQAVS